MTQTDEEFAAHYGPDGPVEAARQFVHAILVDRDMRGGWALVCEELRRELADEWLRSQLPALGDKQGRQGVRDAFASEPFEHALWDLFAAQMLEAFSRAWANIDLNTWGWASRPRPVEPNRELVLLVNTGRAEAVKMATETVLPARGFVMEHGEDGWRVAELTTGEFNPSMN